MNKLRSHLCKAVITAVLVLAGCQGQAESESKNGASQRTSAPHDVTLLGGTLKAKVPQSMRLQSERGSLLVYTDSNGIIIFNSFSSPKGNSAELLAQSIASQKERDPSLEVVRTYKTHFAGTPADATDITMRAKGREVYMATALGVVNGTAIMIQVLGAKNDRDRIVSRAQTVFSSLSANP